MGNSESQPVANNGAPGMNDMTNPYNTQQNQGFQPLPPKELEQIAPWFAPYKFKFPGKFSDFKKEAEEILHPPEAFDGIRFDYTRLVSPNFAVGHGWVIGSQQQPPNYTLNVNWAKEDGSSSVLTHWSQGDVFARGLTGFGNFALKGVIQASKQPGKSGMNVEVDYNGPDYHISFNGIFPINQYTLSYFQNVSKKTALGCYVVYDYGKNFSLTNFSARFCGRKEVLAIQLAPGIRHLDIAYLHKIDPKVSFATELVLEQSPHQGISAQSALGCQYNLTTGTIKATLASSGKVAVNVSEHLGPSMALNISAEMNHFSHESKLGMGMMMQL